MIRTVVAATPVVTVPVAVDGVPIGAMVFDDAVLATNVIRHHQS